MEESITSMCKALICQLEKNGYASNTIKVYEHTAFGPILRYYEKLGITSYDQSVIDEIAASYEKQLTEGMITKALYTCRMRGIRLLLDYRSSGVLHWQKYDNFEVPEIPEEYKELMDGFLASQDLGESARERIMPIVRRFMLWLSANGIHDIHGICSEDTRCFIEDEHSAGSCSMESVIYAMRLFFRYLESLGFDARKIKMLLSFPTRGRKIQGTFTEDELIRILSGIDRTAIPGKRNFAILSLAASTGILAGDLTGLKLTDIRWGEKELRFVQSKTKKPISLPVRKAVLDSVADYILNERPQVKLPYIFLRCRAPYHALCGPALHGILMGCMDAAGVAHRRGDGKTFHGLRRFVGTGIVSHGGTVSIAAEVLGHQGIAATRQYISMDMDGLRKCVLKRSTIGGVS